MLTMWPVVLLFIIQVKHCYLKHRFKNGDVLSGKGTDGRLVLSNVQKSDIGTYQCKVSTDAGFVSSEQVTLDVKGIFLRMLLYCFKLHQLFVLIE